MLLSLEPRKRSSRLMVYAAPVLAVAMAMVAGGMIFSLLGFEGARAVREVFLAPLVSFSQWQEIGLKAAPIILIGVGLSVGFRANVWNIGAEGQYVVGGLAATGVALATWDMTGFWILPLMCLAGMAGGMAYAAVPAALNTKLNVNEILSSLMLSYVSIQLLNYLVFGPWKDPDGFNFPQTRQFNDDQILPYIGDTYMHLGVPIAFVAAMVFWIVLSRTIFGYEVKVVGASPQAARFGGFRRNRTIWIALLTGGGMAGLAGAFEVAGPFQQMVPAFSVGYGFTAIIVAFLGRLHPIGIVVAGTFLAVSYVGGEISQATVGLPNAAVGVFQALTLFFLLGADVLINYRIRFASRPSGRNLGKA